MESEKMFLKHFEGDLTFTNELTLHLKKLRLSSVCVSYMKSKYVGRTLLRLEWCWDRYRESTELWRNDHEEVISLNLVIGQSIDQNLNKRKKPLVFKLFLVKPHKEILMSTANFLLPDFQKQDNGRIKLKFFNHRIDQTGRYIAYITLKYKLHRKHSNIKNIGDETNTIAVQVAIPKLTELNEFLQLKNNFLEPKTVTPEEKKTFIDFKFGDMELSQNCRRELTITVVQAYFLSAKNYETERIYVEYSFLGEEGPEMESPFSIEMGNFDSPAIFNWSTTFDIDFETNNRKCKLLVNHLKKDEVIKFFIINEPPEYTEAVIPICKEMGFAEMSLRKLLDVDLNVDVCDYEILDYCNPLFVVGFVKIKVEGIYAMKQVLYLIS